MQFLCEIKILIGLSIYFCFDQQGTLLKKRFRKKLKKKKKKNFTCLHDGKLIFVSSIKRLHWLSWLYFSNKTLPSQKNQ